ncbi:hypothetical protein PT974_09702 [Cladobotryum mycophilum]|uniref:SnoaL-like domain-containing protein n=1 Tax=Cladobotryum mycophilum TaxID=491253 RepID=A0ABR0SH06_9HYPO
MSAKTCKEAHEGFMKAFKGGEDSEILDFVSSDVKIYYKGEPKERGAMDFLMILHHQSKRIGADIKVLETKFLDRKNLIQEESVQVKTNDGLSDKDVTTTYSYSDRDGPWLMQKVDTDYDWIFFG